MLSSGHSPLGRGGARPSASGSYPHVEISRRTLRSAGWWQRRMRKAPRRVTLFWDCKFSGRSCRIRSNKNQEFHMAKGNKSQKKEIKKPKKEKPKNSPAALRKQS